MCSVMGTCLEVLGEHIIQLLAQGAQAEGLFLQFDLAGLDAGHIQNIVNQREKMAAQLVRLVQILHGGAVRRQLALGQRQHTNDAIHRGADFVRHTREEGRLGLAGLLGLLQALFEFFNLLVQGGTAAQGGHIHRIAFAAADIHIDPLAVFHMQLIGQLLCAVPRRIAFPEGAARGGVCQLGQQRRHVPLQILRSDAQQGLHIADRVNRQHILAAYQQAHLVRVAVQLLYHLPDRAARHQQAAAFPAGRTHGPGRQLYAPGTPVFFKPGAGQGWAVPTIFGGIVLSLTPKRHVGAEFSCRVAHPAASRHQIWGFAKNFCRCVVINSTIEKTPSPGRRGSHRGAYSPALQLATKALAASAAEV